MTDISRGEVHYVNFNTGYLGSSVMEKRRPAIIVSNDKNNEFSSNVNVVPLSNQIKHLNIPSVVLVSCYDGSSVAHCEQITTVPKDCVDPKVYFRLSRMDMIKVDDALRIQLGL